MNGKLNLSMAFDGQKTVTDDLYFTPPFKVYSPFYNETGWAKYILMCSSAGVLAGDENEIHLLAGENCKVIFTDQGYQKLFHTNSGVSRQHIALTVQKNAKLCYMPHPIMTFTGCEHISSCNANLTKSASLIFSEVYCCGRTAMGEAFGLKRFRSRTEITIDGRADFIDNTLIDPAALPIRQKGFFEGFTHTGFLYLYTPNKTALENVYESAYLTQANSIQLCATHTACGIAIRALGYSGEEIYDAFQKVAKEICI